MLEHHLIDILTICKIRLLKEQNTKGIACFSSISYHSMKIVPAYLDDLFKQLMILIHERHFKR